MGEGKNRKACPLSFFYHKLPNFSLSLSLFLKVYTCKLPTLEKPGLMEKRGRKREKRGRKREKRGAHFLSQAHQEIHVNKLDNSEH